MLQLTNNFSKNKANKAHYLCLITIVFGYLSLLTYYIGFELSQLILLLSNFNIPVEKFSFVILCVISVAGIVYGVNKRIYKNIILLYLFPIICIFLAILIIVLSNTLLTINLPLKNCYFFIFLAVISFFHISYINKGISVAHTQKHLSVVLLALIILILIFSIFLIFYNANFVLGDDTIFFSNIVQGYKPPSYKYPAAGRYTPMALWNYAWVILTPFYSKAWPYFLNNVILMLLTYFVFFKALQYTKLLANKNNPIALLALLCIIFITSLACIYMDLPFPEKIILFALSIFLWGVTWEEKNNASTLKNYIIYSLVLLIYAFATYCKEPVFIIGFIFGMGNIILNYKNLSKVAKYFNILLIINAVLFLAMYVKNVGIHHGDNSYLQLAQHISYFMILKDYFFHIFWFLYVIPLILLLFRLYKVLLKQDRTLLKADLVLCAGIAYVVGFFLLKLLFAYYYLPALLLIFYSLCIYAQHYYAFAKRYKTVILLLIIIQSLLTLYPLKKSLQNEWLSAFYYQYARKYDHLFFNAVLNLYLNKKHIIFRPSGNENQVLNSGAWQANLLAIFLTQVSGFKHPEDMDYKKTSFFNYLSTKYSYYLQFNDILIISPKSSSESIGDILKGANIKKGQNSVYFLGNHNNYYVYSTNPDLEVFFRDLGWTSTKIH